LGWQAWFTLSVVVLAFVALVRGVGPADMVLWAGTILVALLGIVEVSDVLAGFANPGMLTVGALFMISGGLRETGALDRIGSRMLGNVRTERRALLRVAPQVAALSAFLNNTAVVAMLMSVISDWCRKHRISPSRLLMPLSYLAILGGMCTLIGTSTNLVVSSLMVEAKLKEIGLFELAYVGVPATLVGIAYLLLVGSRLLPDRKDMLEKIGESAREYLVEMRIQPNCPLVGKPVEEAGLRRLPGLFLIEIARGDRIIAPVEPDEVLLAGDHLTFAGVVQTIVDLERIPGLLPIAEEAVDESFAERRQRRYCEAVVSSTSPLIARNIRDSNFRALYNAAVIAVHRGGARLTGRIGDIVLRAGDTLLLQTGPHFASANRNNPDFYLVSGLEEARPVRHERSWISFALLGLFILLLVFGGRFGVSTAVAAFFVAGAMIATRCISAADARRAVHLDVLLTITAAFGLGKALEVSGAAKALADIVVVSTSQWGPTAALAMVYLVTICFTTLITNNATAVLIFPVAVAVAAELGADPRPFAIAVAAGAAASFATPISYQTNMMVYGPGGYRFTDFLRVGLPLNLLLMVVALLVIPLVWPL
jgi:di/tricarboxylate transporter